MENLQGEDFYSIPGVHTDSIEHTGYSASFVDQENTSLMAEGYRKFPRKTEILLEKLPRTSKKNKKTSGWH